MSQDEPGPGLAGRDVFISYASSEAAVAGVLCAGLERHGVACWIAPRDVVPGEYYADAIVRAINETRLLVLVLTEAAASSPHVLREVERASAKRHPIIAVRLHALALPPALEYFLSASHWLDAGTDALDLVAPRLAAAVERLLGRNTSGPMPRAGESVVSPLPVPLLPGRMPRWPVIALAAVVTLAAALMLSRRWSAPDPVPAPAAAPGTGLTAARPEKSIAVLPFVDMSEAKYQEYFSDGLSEELLNTLSKIPGLRVAARTSAFSFKGKSDDIPTIARRLMVAQVLEGSVRKSGSHVRITVQLVRADNGYHLWSETYDRELKDIFAVQDDIAAAVARALSLSLQQGEHAIYRPDAKAYALYMRARYLSSQGTASGLEQSIALAHQALDIDPKYATAWVLLASDYSNQALRGMRPLDEGYRLASEAANKAAAVDPELAAAHVYLGIIALDHDHDLVAAARHLGRASELEPTNLNVMDLGAGLADSLGLHDKAIALHEYIAARDPANASAHGNLGVDYLFAGRFDDAIASWRTALTLSPAYEGLQFDIGMAQVLKGHPDLALASIQREPAESWRLIGLAMVFHSLRRTAESDAALSSLIEKYGPEWPYNIAYVCAWRGESGRAFEWLQKAAAIKDSGLSYITVEPYFANLRNDARWKPFLRQVGMSAEQVRAIPFTIRLPPA